jgi:hypothetical protein
MVILRIANQMIRDHSLDRWKLEFSSFFTMVGWLRRRDYVT